MTHIDYMFEDANNVIFIENKATKDNTYVTINKYANQLHWHKMLLIEYCNKVKKTPKLLISHYNTSDYDGKFKPEKLTIVDLTKAALIPFEIEQGLDIIDIYLEKFVYEKKSLLSLIICLIASENARIIGNKLSKIKQLENDVDNFKAKMLDLMNKNNIKNIKTPYFSITKLKKVITQMKFDTTTFKKEHENLYKSFSKPTIKKIIYINQNKIKSWKHNKQHNKSHKNHKRNTKSLIVLLEIKVLPIILADILKIKKTNLFQIWLV